MIKTAETIQKGDIFRSEYGDYGNWNKFVFVSCEQMKDRSTKINVHRIGDNEVFSVYRLEPIDKVKFNVVGREDNK